jgi:hypothetical protein
MRSLHPPQWFFKGYEPSFVVYVLAAIIFSVQSLLLDPSYVGPFGGSYPLYNNYTIFKQSFFHLIHNQDLYIAYFDEHGDLYKYSPTFALLFAPFAFLPDAIGLTLWNLLNTIVLWFAFRMLPALDVRTKVWMLLFAFVEFTTSVASAQSNVLIAGMIILAFALLEKDRYFLAALLIAGTAYIKIFGIVGFALVILYPHKGKFMVASGLCLVALAILPLLVISVDQLGFLYRGWVDLMVSDHSASDGLSVMGWLTTWFDLVVNKIVIVAVGIVLFGLPFLRWNRYGDYTYRTSMLASILIWIVIFNHRAESQTYIIAISGVAVWYFSRAKTITNFFLILITFVFTCLSPTDIFPAYVQDNYFDPYVIKAVPCMVIWIKIIAESFLEKKMHNQHRNMPEIHEASRNRHLVVKKPF